MTPTAFAFPTVLRAVLADSCQFAGSVSAYFSFTGGGALLPPVLQCRQSVPRRAGRHRLLG